jgi:hypothetical protein
MDAAAVQRFATKRLLDMYAVHLKWVHLPNGIKVSIGFQASDFLINMFKYSNENDLFIPLNPIIVVRMCTQWGFGRRFLEPLTGIQRNGLPRETFSLHDVLQIISGLLRTPLDHCRRRRALLPRNSVTLRYCDHTIKLAEMCGEELRMRITQAKELDEPMSSIGDDQLGGKVLLAAAVQELQFSVDHINHGEWHEEECRQHELYNELFILMRRIIFTNIALADTMPIGASSRIKDLLKEFVTGRERDFEVACLWENCLN